MVVGYLGRPSTAVSEAVADRIRRTVALLRRRGFAVTPSRLAEMCLGGPVSEADVRWAAAASPELALAEDLVVERSALGERARSVAGRWATLRNRRVRRPDPSLCPHAGCRGPVHPERFDRGIPRQRRFPGLRRRRPEPDRRRRTPPPCLRAGQPPRCCPRAASPRQAGRRPDAPSARAAPR